MITKTRVAIGATALLGAALVPVAVAAPAQAGWLCDATFGAECGDLRHSTPDYGFDGPILVTCNLGDPWSATQRVHEGQDATCRDVDGFRVDPNTTVTCTWSGDGYGSYTYGYSGNWVKINDGQNFSCVTGLP